MADRKTAFGRALASIRAGRGLTISDIAAQTGIAMSVVGALETGRRHVDGAVVAGIDAKLALSHDERRRLAEGMAASGSDGDDVRYDVKPGCPSGHRASALLTVFAADITPITWGRISALVEAELAALAARAAA